MIIRPGTALGPYEVVAPLDAGGMGSVFRGRDPRLGREVAIKVLPVASMKDERRVKRFLREARAAAAVTHPNIVAIYDVGEAEVDLAAPVGAERVALRFLVEEFVEGPSLRRLLRSGRPPLGKLVEIATGVARGLGAAHEKGLIHRDLKPENVLLDARGTAKIADFGLVRFIYPDTAAPGDEAEKDDVTETLTRSGFVVGTLGYMSPEQVRGDPLGPSSDLFALGIVLYEMLAGETPFSRSAFGDPFTAILKEPTPRVLERIPGTPPRLAHVIERCLEKDAARRYPSAARVLVHLEELRRELRLDTGRAASPRASAVLPTVAAAEPTKRSARPHGGGHHLALALAGGALAVLVAFAGGWVVGRTRPAPASANPVDPRLLADSWRATRVLDGLAERCVAAALSPDGRRAALASAGDGVGAELIVAAPNSSPEAATVAAGFASIEAPAFGNASVLFVGARDGSPSGIWLARLTEAAGLVAAADGEPQPVAEGGEDPAVSPDGSLLVFVRRSAGGSELWLASPGGAKARPFASAPGRSLRHPVFVEGGGAVLAVDLADPVGPDAGSGILFSSPLADARLVPFGTGRAVDAGVRPAPLGDGTLIVVSWPDRSAWLLDGAGETARRLPFGAGLTHLAASADGRSVLTRTGNGPLILWRRG